MIGILLGLRLWAGQTGFSEYQSETSREYLQTLSRTIEEQAGSGSETRLLQARIHQQLGLHDAAERLARESFAIDAHQAEAPSFLANLCIRQDRLDEAAKYLRLALEQYPQLESGCRRLGMVLDRLGDPAGARTAFEQGARQSTNDATVRLLLGRLLLDQDKASEAIPYLEKACQLDTNLANAFYVLAQAYTRLGKTDDAQPKMRIFHQLKQREKEFMDADNASYDDAKTMRDSVANFHADAALLLINQKQESLAEAHLRQAIAVAPKQTRSHELLAGLCLRTGRLTEAKGFFETLTRLRPKDAPYQLNLGTLLLQLKEYPAAVETLRRALELDPCSVEALNNLARYYLGSRQEMVEALALCRRLVEISPSAANYDLLGWGLYANGRLEEARAASATAVEQDPANPTYQEHQRRLK